MIVTDFKNKLMSALQDSVGHLNTGSTPNESVAKAAAAADFNPEQTRRLCETFNTARTIYHFQSKPNEKDASFPLADQDEVLGILYAAPIKAAVKHDVLPDYSEYEVREVMAKAANEDTPLSPAPLETELGAISDQTRQNMLNEQARRAHKMIDTQRDLAKNAESEANQADILISMKTSALAKNILNAVNSLEKYARLWTVCDTPKYVPIMAGLQSHLPSVKVARVTDHVVDDRDLGAWKQAVDEIQRLTESASNLRAVATSMQKDADDFEKQFNELLENKSDTEKREGLFDDILKGEVKTAGKSGPFFSLSTLGFGDAGEQKDKPKLALPPSVAATSDVAKAVSKPSELAMHTVGHALKAKSNTNQVIERLKNQQREVLMQDLITNDPYISEADPKMVAGIYQQLAQLSPEVSTNKEVVRAILRQGIHSAAISPYDAAAMVDLEKTIREVAGTLPLRKKE